MKTLNKKDVNSKDIIKYKINYISRLLVIFLLIISLLSYSVPLSFNPIFLAVYYICKGIILVLLFIDIFYTFWWMWVNHGK